MKAAEQAYNVLRTGIIEGSFAPGNRITESEIAEAAGVSRTPVREALRRLEAEGLIRFVPNQGAFVSTWDQTDVEDIFELRALLEPLAARLCAERANTAQALRLNDLARQQSKIVSTRPRDVLEQVAALNSQFHQLIMEAAGSEQLKAALAVLSNAPLVFQTLRDYESDDLERSARHHREIAEAVMAGDGAWAASVMRTHILAARGVFRDHHQQTDTANS